MARTRTKAKKSIDDCVKFARRLLPEALDETEARLLARGAPLFQTGGRLVELIRLDAADDSDGVRRPAGSLQMAPLSAYRLLEVLLRHVDFAIYDKQKSKYVLGAPPLDFAKHFAARGQWRLRVLRGMVEAPTLRPDGTLLTKPGYDAESGIYFDSAGVEFPRVPDSPSREDAMHALGLLKETIAGFPFVPDDREADLGAPSAGRSVALSALLTGGCRKALRTAPAHGFDAASMGTGKTLMCDTVSRLWLGRDSAAIGQGKSNEEFEKRIFSALLKGDPIVVVDNIDRPLESDEFCSVLTSTSYQSRILGLSKNGTVNTQVLWLVNGNGLSFEGDLRTRVVLSRMDAHCERPEERRFDVDLAKYVLANRPALVAAALTVLRAFVVAGRPGVRELTVFGRFEEWSDLVRGALVWLGEPDPVATREAVAALDPERERLAALLRAWEAAIGAGRWVTAKEVLGVCEMGYRRSHTEGESAGDALREALDEVAESRAAWSPSTLGRVLSHYSRRIVDGRSIQTDARLGRATLFALRVEAGE